MLELHAMILEISGTALVQNLD